jgi:hypothetical protein
MAQKKDINPIARGTILLDLVTAPSLTEGQYLENESNGKYNK